MVQRTGSVVRVPLGAGACGSAAADAVGAARKATTLCRHVEFVLYSHYNAPAIGLSAVAAKTQLNSDGVGLTALDGVVTLTARADLDLGKLGGCGSRHWLAAAAVICPSTQ